jgi:hypothetical protein
MKLERVIMVSAEISRGHGATDEVRDGGGVLSMGGSPGIATPPDVAWLGSTGKTRTECAPVRARSASTVADRNLTASSITRGGSS